VNLEQPFVSSFPLGEAARRFPGSVPDTSDCDDSAEVAARLVEVRARLCRRLASEVAADPAAAVDWMLAVMQRLPETDRETGTVGHPVVIAQTVCLELLRLGPLPAMPQPRRAALPPFWLEPVVDLCCVAELAAKFVREAEVRGRLSLCDGHVRCVSPDEDVWAGEVNATLFAEEEREPESLRLLANPDLMEAERAVFGWSVTDFLLLVGDLDELRRATRVGGNEELWFFDLGPQALPALRAMVGDFILTPERMCRQAAPAFFAEAGMQVSRSYDEAVETAVGVEWLTYVPVVAAGYPGERGISPAGITSAYLIRRALGRAWSSVAYRLHCAEQVARRRDPELAAHVAGLARRFHASLEREVGDALETAGLRALPNVERVGGRRPSCGEIDVIAGGTDRAGTPLALVVEVKNFDVSFYKDFGIGETREKVAGACRQAARKAAWVRDHWRDVAPLVAGDPESSPLVVGLVATRALGLPPPPGGVGIIPLRALGATATKLLDRPVGEWRPDVRAGVASGAGA
jgi:hypothetical protein